MAKVSPIKVKSGTDYSNSKKPVSADDIKNRKSTLEKDKKGKGGILTISDANGSMDPRHATRIKLFDAANVDIAKSQVLGDRASKPTPETKFDKKDDGLRFRPTLVNKKGGKRELQYFQTVASETGKYTKFGMDRLYNQKGANIVVDYIEDRHKKYQKVYNFSQAAEQSARQIKSDEWNDTLKNYHAALKQQNTWKPWQKNEAQKRINELNQKYGDIQQFAKDAGITVEQLYYMI